VTYVIQRVESLMALFYLLTLYCAIRAWDPGRRRRWWIAGAIAASACGMATKEVMVTAPLVVLLWDWTFGPAQSWREIRAQRWPLYLGLAATWIPLAILVAGLPRHAAVGYGYGWTWWSYLVTQTAIITHYLRLTLIPAPLVFDYGWRPASLLSVLPQAVLIVSLAVLTIWMVIKRRPLGFLGAWVFLILGPSSSVLPVATETAAEHRMYLPLAAVLTLLVVGSVRLFTRFKVLPARAAVVTGVLVLAAVATTYGWMTRERNRDYWTNEGLWAKTVSQRPDSARAHAVYAVALLTRAAYDEAEPHLRTAIRLDDTSALAYRNLGITLCATQRTAECIPVLERSAVLEPESGETHGLLAEAYLAERQPVRAIREFLRAIELMPDNRALRFLLYRTAWLLSTLPEADVRNGPKAVELAERGARLTRREDARMLDALAAAYAETGRFADALAAGRDALTVAERQQERALVAEINQHLVAFAAGQKLRQFQSPAPTP
jgi:tetratricopeptide (TPR) repeat protein